jgi:putative ATPase
LPKFRKSETFSNIVLDGTLDCGETRLTEVTANEMESKFIKINTILSNVSELRETFMISRRYPDSNISLFIDEIHVFDKEQQDLLLPNVENANI